MIHDSPSRLRDVRQALCILGALWCLLPTLTAAVLGVGLTAMSWPDYQRPIDMSITEFKARFVFTTFFGVVGLAIGLLNCVRHIAPGAGSHRRWWSTVTAWLGVPAVFSLPAVVACFPMEDEFTGLSSPETALVTAFFIALGIGVLVAPVAIALLVYHEQRERRSALADSPIT